MHIITQPKKFKSNSSLQNKNLYYSSTIITTPIRLSTSPTPIHVASTLPIPAIPVELSSPASQHPLNQFSPLTSSRGSSAYLHQPTTPICVGIDGNVCGRWTVELEQGSYGVCMRTASVKGGFMATDKSAVRK